ncbi:class I SAM-dependent methyltransferase [Patescibacteria group bacterium]|nr:class I SAM-dependent methyltransferase [Patescibacteria group bacterium]
MILNDKKIKSLYSENILSNTINAIKLCKILRNKEAVVFVKKLIVTHYKKNFSEYKPMILATDKALDELIKGQINKTSIAKLKKSMNLISEYIYTTKNIPKFFKKYNLYKSSLKPKYYFSIIEKDIVGNKIIDFGTGKGYMSRYLFNQGFNVISADILDYRETNKNYIPFIKINYTDEISDKIPLQDTSLLLTVLHHISQKNIPDTLQELSKITKRLIIIEDIWDSSYIDENKKLLNNSNNIKEFLKLSAKTKKDSIELMDFYGNVVTQGLIKMNLPFQFKSVESWKKILHESGFSVNNVEFIGLPQISFHGFFQIKIVCDSIKYTKNN